MCVCVRAYACICIHVYMYVYAYAHMHLSCVCINAFVCVHMKTCIYSYVSMHTYVYIHSVCVFNTNQMLAWSIYLFPLCFKSGKSMFPILCAEGLHGTYEHINLRQVSLIEEAY